MSQLSNNNQLKTHKYKINKQTKSNKEQKHTKAHTHTQISKAISK
jgi:hypothetical protein